MHHRFSLAALVLALAPLAGATPVQFTAPTTLPGDSMPVVPSAAQIRPVLSRGGDQYLMVWADARTDLSETVDNFGTGPNTLDILALRLDDQGQAIDPHPIQVSSRPFAQEEPDVAWNGSEWLVVWQDRVETSNSNTRNIAGARVSAAGVVLDHPQIDIEVSDDADEFRPSVASDGTDWLVSWEDTNPNNGNTQRRVARVDSMGIVGPKNNLFSHSYGGYVLRDGDLAFASGRYLLVANRPVSTGNGEVIGILVDPVTLDPIGPEIGISSLGENAAVASDGTGFHVVWSVDEPVYDRVYGTNVSATGVVADVDGIQLSPTFQPVELEPQVTWDGQNWLVAVDDTSSSSERIDVYTLTPAGIPFGLSTLVDQAPRAFGAVLASDPGSGVTLAVWEDYRKQNTATDLYGARLSGGAVTQLGPMEKSTADQTHPDLAGDFDAGYLVVFVRKSSGRFKIMGQRIDGHGAPVDAEPFVIDNDANVNFYPRVAWNGSSWLVVWEKRSSELYLPGAAVYARRVAQDGSLGGPAVKVLDGNWPDVASKDGEFLVVASDEPFNHLRYVEVRRVDSGGAAYGATHRISGNHARFTRVDVLGDSYVVTWQHNPTHDNPNDKVYGALFDDSNATTTLLPGSPGGERPDVASTGAHAAIVWRVGSAIQKRVLDATGNELALANFSVTSGPHQRMTQAVGSDGASFLATWTDYRAQPTNQAGLGDVLATQFDVQGNNLLQDVPVADQLEVPEGGGSVAGGNGITLVVYPEFMNDPIHFGWRIRVRTLGAAGSSVVYCTAGQSASGCQALLSSSGLASASASSGFLLSANGVEGAKDGLFFFADNGRQANPWGSGTSYQCVVPPVMRGGLLPGVGSAGACDGSFTQDLNALWCSSCPGAPKNPGAGALVQAQLWYRDPLNTSNQTTSLSNAIEFQVIP